MMRKLALILCFFTGTAFAKDLTSTLTINGSAILKKPADQLNLSVSVITEAETAEAALQANSLKMKAVIAAIQVKEVKNKEYATGQFNISPTYTQYPNNTPPEGTQKINGYRVTNSLFIQTEKMDLAGELIDAVSEAGANSVDQISFGLKDDRLYRQDAIKQATMHARQDAEDLAMAANLKLGRIQQIWLDNARAPEPEPRMKMFAASLDRTTPIEPSDVTVNANVTIVYQVQPE